MKYSTEKYHEWLRWLGDVIERETAKEDGAADMGLVEACEALMCELAAAKEGAPVMTEAMLAARLADIKARGAIPNPAPRILRPTRLGKAAACVALAAVLGIGGLTAVSAWRTKTDTPEVTQSADPVRDPDGETWEGVRYRMAGASVDYEDIETLLEAQALEIPYPTALPAGVTVTEVSVDVTVDPAVVTYGFSEPALTMSVALNTAADESALAKVGEAYTAGGMVSYLSATESGYRATVIGAGTVATVESGSRETVTAVLDGLSESTPINPHWTNMAIHDGYLYYVEDICLSRTYSVIRRMDLATGEISTPCTAEGCTHERDQCPFYSGRVRRGFLIFGDWMHIEELSYWDKENTANASTRETQFLYNLKTGEVRQLPAVLRDSFKSIRVGNCLYFVKHGNSLTDSDGVTRTYCKVYEYNIDTAQYRVVYEHDDLIALLYGGNTRIYFFRETQTGESDTVTCYSFNPETGDMREEPTVTMRSYDVLYRNRLYALETDSETLERAVSVNDAATGETFQILKDGLLAFSLTEDGLYYIRMEEYAAYTEAYRQRFAALREALAHLEESGRTRVEVWAQYELDCRKDIAQWLMPYDMEIWHCDLDGENAVRLYEIPFAAIDASFWIENGTLYTYADLFDPETGEDLTVNGTTVPVAVDLKTGEMTLLSPAALQ